VAGLRGSDWGWCGAGFLDLPEQSQLRFKAGQSASTFSGLGLRNGLGGRRGLLAGGLEFDQELEVAAVVALGGIDASLDYG